MSLSRGKAVIKSFAERLPDSPGVYQMRGSKGQYLYIGKAKALKRRVTNYTITDNLVVRLQRMVAETVEMQFTLTETEAEALLLEANLIKTHKPKYNILLQDDKSFPYLVIDTTHPFPSLAKYRGAREKGKKYFGPFASAGAVTKTLIDMQRGFMLRNCTDSYFAARKRPCLQYHIKRCTAPCVALASKDEYGAQVDEAVAFLSGKASNIQKKLQDKMSAESEAMNFEAAAMYRDRLAALAQVQTRNAIYQQELEEADVFVLARRGAVSSIAVFFIRNWCNYGQTTFYPRHDEEASDAQLMANFIGQFYAKRPAPKLVIVSAEPEGKDVLEKALAVMAEQKVEICKPSRGEKARLVGWAMKTAEQALALHISQTKVTEELMRQLGELAGLDAPPARIEVYDNSHIQGAFKVGAYVVYETAGFNKKEYRQYNINTVKAGDDFAMMREVMQRRVARIADGGARPDLMLIDGGKGQLSQIMGQIEAFWPEDVPPCAVIAVAKGEDRNAGREVLHFPDGREVRLEPKDPLLHFIQRLRDEAHRFVIGRHRQKREKAISVSTLDDLPNIGPSRKKALLHHFGSAKAVKGAGVLELSRVEGISKRLAEQIYKYFNE